MLAEKIENLAGYFILLTGWQRAVAAMFAGLLLVLAMPPFNLFFVGFISFPVLVWLLDGVASEPASSLRHRLWMAFKPGFFFGFGYFFGGLWWIGNAMLVESDRFAWAIPLAVTALPAFLAGFWGIATAGARLFWRGGAERLFMLAFFFALLEYLRGTVATGFPWNSIGYAAYFSPLFMQTASLLGVYGVAAFVVFSFCAPGIMVPGSSRQTASRRTVFCLALVFFAAHTGYGYYRMPSDPSPAVDGVNLRLMQPGIAQEEKWDPEHESEIFNKYLSLSTSTGETASGPLSSVSHLIWPESAFPFLLTQRKDALSAIASMLPEGTSLITGAARAEAAQTEDALVFNSIYVVDHRGEIVSAADKVHLVPFGEYLPFQDIAEAVGLSQLAGQAGGFESGSSRKILSTNLGPGFLPLICYEIIFSGDVWDGSERPEWILNLTNDAWFGVTPGPYQHHQQAIIRGVEEGVPVVRVANSGISSVSDAYGRVVGTMALGEVGVLDSPLPAAHGPTFFSLHGYMAFWVVLTVFFGLGLIFFRRGTGTA